MYKPCYLSVEVLAAILRPHSDLSSEKTNLPWGRRNETVVVISLL